MFLRRKGFSSLHPIGRHTEADTRARVVRVTAQSASDSGMHQQGRQEAEAAAAATAAADSGIQQ
jgi:hypothetical protein